MSNPTKQTKDLIKTLYINNKLDSRSRKEKGQMIKRDENGKIIIRGKKVNYNLGINLETRQLLKNIIFWCECVDTRDRLYNLVIMIERKLKEKKEDK